MLAMIQDASAQRRRRWRNGSAIFLWVGFLTAGAAQAQPSNDQGHLSLSPYNVDPVADTVALFAAASVWTLIEAVVKPTLRGGLVCDAQPGTDRCDAGTLNGLDQLAVNQTSENWYRLTDLAALTSYIVPLAVLGMESVFRETNAPWRDFLGDSAVIAQSTVFAGLFGVLTKMAVRRPRPTQYSEGRFIGSAEHQLSFPSGHVTSVAAATTAFSTTFALRHPDSPWRFVVIGAGVLLTGVTAYGRVASGYHFPTDVLAGAIIGASSGILVPWLHRKSVSIEPNIIPVEPASSQGRMPLGLSFSGAF